MSAIALVILTWGCENPPPAERPEPATQPEGAAPPAQTRPAPPPVVLEPGPAPGAPPTTRPTSQPAVEPEPEPPDYLTILERFEPARRASANGRVEAGNRLVVDTQNVKRLRIERTALPMMARRSIALQLDQQVIEWLADSPVVEFERSVNGAWSPVPHKSIRRR